RSGGRCHGDGPSEERGRDFDDRGEGPVEVEVRKVRITKHWLQLGPDLRRQLCQTVRRNIHGLVSGDGEFLLDELDDPGLLYAKASPADGVVDIVEIADGDFSSGQRRSELLCHRLVPRQAGHGKGGHRGRPGDGVEQQRLRLPPDRGPQQRLAEAYLYLDALVPLRDGRSVADRAAVNLTASRKSAASSCRRSGLRSATLVPDNTPGVVDCPTFPPRRNPRDHTRRGLERLA